MKERVLSLGLKGALDAFSSIKWKFHEDRDGAVRLEVPRGDAESYVVHLPYGNEVEKAGIVKALEAAGWVKQEVRYVVDY